mmetsp:Transcript_35046/g.81059  ORF Transcript_35046/g.81059 Transcript_35046/m.81059 type:complete len:343 (+) Transcript_35046:325-1353(+)
MGVQRRGSVVGVGRGVDPDAFRQTTFAVGVVGAEEEGGPLGSARHGGVLVLSVRSGPAAVKAVAGGGMGFVSPRGVVAGAFLGDGLAVVVAEFLVGESTVGDGETRAEDVVHGVAQDGAGPFGVHALGPGDGELQASAVVAVHREKGAGAGAGLFVALVTLHVFLGVPQAGAFGDGFSEHLADVVVDELFMTDGVHVFLSQGGVLVVGGAVGEMSRARRPVVGVVRAVGVGSVVASLVLHLPPTGFESGAFHVGRLHDVLKEFLHVREGVDDRLAHDVVSLFVMLHESFGYGEETLLLTREGVHEELRGHGGHGLALVRGRGDGGLVAIGGGRVGVGGGGGM